MYIIDAENSSYAIEGLVTTRDCTTMIAVRKVSRLKHASDARNVNGNQLGRIVPRRVKRKCMTQMKRGRIQTPCNRGREDEGGSRVEAITAQTQEKQRQNSNFEGTPSAVKMLVSGLTGLLKSFSSNIEYSDKELVQKRKFTPEELRDGIQKDFESAFLLTGEINEELYHTYCTFTDPTLSFEGLETFKQNIQSIKPLIDAIIAPPINDNNAISTESIGRNVTEVKLYSCELDEQRRQITAKWRMLGPIRQLIYH